MLHAFGIEARPGPLRDDVYEIILEIFGNARDKRYTDRRRQRPLTPRMNCAVVYSLNRVAYLSMT